MNRSDNIIFCLITCAVIVVELHGERFASFQVAFFIVETMYVITYALSVLEENTPAFYILYWLVAVIGAGEDGFIIEDVCFDIDVSGSIFIPLALGGRDSCLKVIYNGDVIPE